MQRWHIGYRPERVSLSVSSVGSEAMQLPLLQHTQIAASSPFSILGRIGGDATSPGCPDVRIAWILFQYPRSDRRRCNHQASPWHPAPKRHFQYPRSDRRRCNNYPGVGIISSQDPFSILGRIGGDATAPPPPTSETKWYYLSVSSVGSEAMQPATLTVCISPSWSFQYPRSDRRRCNKHYQNLWSQERFLSVSSVGSEAMQLHFKALLALARWPLSVSSVGSEAMQRPASAAPAAPAPRLSVSSVGSEAMQRPESECTGQTSETFSILGRIGGDATRRKRERQEQSQNNFQYPRSDRRRCNSGCRGPRRPA